MVKAHTHQWRPITWSCKGYGSGSYQQCSICRERKDFQTQLEPAPQAPQELNLFLDWLKGATGEN
jgi:hypothetical protein